jgi:sulfur-carrier protein
MRVRLKLFATLSTYLPVGAKDNAVDLEVEAGTTPHQLIARYRIPFEQAHLVVVNGVFVAPSERDRLALGEGDVLALWPPVAGG